MLFVCSACCSSAFAAFRRDLQQKQHYTMDVPAFIRASSCTVCSFVPTAHWKRESLLCYEGGRVALLRRNRSNETAVSWWYLQLLAHASWCGVILGSSASGWCEPECRGGRMVPFGRVVVATVLLVHGAGVTTTTAASECLGATRLRSNSLSLLRRRFRSTSCFVVERDVIGSAFLG